MNDPLPNVLPCQFDEMAPAGRDFRSREVVEAYDAFHRRFRDVDAENAAILSTLGIDASQTLADFGCGTGAFAIEAARHCARVHAIDISKAMLDYTAWKAQIQGVANVACHHGGFLTYVHIDPPLNAITSSLALHHLPDFWKQKALLRLNGMLEPGGRLFLADVVFPEIKCDAAITQWIRETTAKAGPDVEEDLIRHIRIEYSTFDWIMRGLLERAGFRVDHVARSGGVLTQYLCTKIEGRRCQS